MTIKDRINQQVYEYLSSNAHQINSWTVAADDITNLILEELQNELRYAEEYIVRLERFKEVLDLYL